MDLLKHRSNELKAAAFIAMALVIASDLKFMQMLIMLTYVHDDYNMHATRTHSHTNVGA